MHLQNSILLLKSMQNQEPAACQDMQKSHERGVNDRLARFSVQNSKKELHLQRTHFQKQWSWTHRTLKSRKHLLYELSFTVYTQNRCNQRLSDAEQTHEGHQRDKCAWI